MIGEYAFRLLQVEDPREEHREPFVRYSDVVDSFLREDASRPQSVGCAAERRPAVPERAADLKKRIRVREGTGEEAPGTRPDI